MISPMVCFSSAVLKGVSLSFRGSGSLVLLFCDMKFSAEVVATRAARMSADAS